MHPGVEFGFRLLHRSIVCQKSLLIGTVCVLLLFFKFNISLGLCVASLVLLVRSIPIILIGIKIHINVSKFVHYATEKCTGNCCDFIRITVITNVPCLFEFLHRLHNYSFSTIKWTSVICVNGSKHKIFIGLQYK